MSEPYTGSDEMSSSPVPWVTLIASTPLAANSAMGYLIEHTSADRVCQAIREVHKGNTFFSPTKPGGWLA